MEIARQKNSARNELEHIQAEIDKRAFYYGEVEHVKQNLDTLRKKESSLQGKIDLLMRVRKAVNTAVKTYEKNFPSLQEHTITLPADIVHQAEDLAPSVMLKLPGMNYRDLRRAFRANEKLIEDTLTRYETRYTTKANRAIYRLMVIALRAELQNILYTLTSSKLSDALAKAPLPTTASSTAVTSIRARNKKSPYVGAKIFRSVIENEIEYERQNPFGRLGFAAVPILNRAIWRVEHVA